MTYADARRRLLLEYIVACVIVSYCSSLAKVAVLQNVDLCSAAVDVSKVHCTDEERSAVDCGQICDAFQQGCDLL